MASLDFIRPVLSIGFLVVYACWLLLCPTSPMAAPKLPHEIVLGAQKQYFSGVSRAPRVDNVDGRDRWHFEPEQGFEYEPFWIDLPTRFILQDVLTLDGDGKDAKVIYPQGAAHSGDALKQAFTASKKWPPWVTFTRGKNQTFSMSHQHQAKWDCYCGHDGCNTTFDVTVSLEDAQDGLQLTTVYANFTSAQPCMHWAHERAGSLAKADKEQFLGMQPLQAWTQSQDTQRQTEKQIYGNCDGHLKNLEQARNVRKASLHVPLDEQYDVFDNKWMGRVIQLAYQTKYDDLKGVKERGLEWNTLGWIHQPDFVNVEMAIYHTSTCEMFINFPTAFPNGIFVDDMSNLVKVILGRRICHTIGFAKHPAGRLPLGVFELISGDWGMLSFETMFGRWWRFTNLYYEATVYCFNTDWDRKLQDGICKTVNGFDLKEYNRRCLIIAQEKATLSEIEVCLKQQFRCLMFACHGHGAAAMVRHSIGQPNFKELSLQSWRWLRSVRDYDMWLRGVSFLKFVFETESYSSMLSYDFDLIDPIAMLDFSSFEASDAEMDQLKFLLFGERQNRDEAPSDAEMKHDDAGWEREFLAEVEALPGDEQKRNDSNAPQPDAHLSVLQEELRFVSANNHVFEIIPKINGEPQNVFKMRVDLDSGSVIYFPFRAELTIVAEKNIGRGLPVIEDPNGFKYLWRTFHQFFGLYSPVVHQHRTQWTTGVGERGNRQRRALLQDAGNNPTIDVYGKKVIEYSRQQQANLISECQATISIKKRRKQDGVPPSKYKKRKGWQSCSKSEMRVVEKWSTVKSHLQKYRGGNGKSLSNKMILDSIKKFDTNNICTRKWKDSTFLTKISAINGSSSFCKDSEQVIQVLVDWCDAALTKRSSRAVLEFLAIPYVDYTSSNTENMVDVD